MKPPGRSSDSSTRHPASGSARWCSTPDASIEVEAAPERAEREDVGLAIFDVGAPERARLALGIGEAGEAQIDREHAGAGEPLRGLDRMLAGAAAGDQDVDSRLAEGLRRWRPATGGAGIDRKAAALPAGPPSPSADTDFPRIAAGPRATPRSRSP